MILHNPGLAGSGSGSGSRSGFGSQSLDLGSGVGLGLGLGLDTNEYSMICFHLQNPINHFDSHRVLPPPCVHQVLVGFFFFFLHDLCCSLCLKLLPLQLNYHESDTDWFTGSEWNDRFTCFLAVDVSVSVVYLLQ